MIPSKTIKPVLASLVGMALAIASSVAVAEGSRQLYPSSYPGSGSRANLDLQDNGRYMDRVNRLGFVYVYAQANEYITVGSSNIGSGGDVNIYLPQDFGIPGDETIPGSADFNCADPTPSVPGTHFSGSNFGRIQSRTEELAGPNSPDNTVTLSNGYLPCAFQAPETGIYGVLFTTGSGGGPNGNVGSVASSSRTVAAWDVSMRATRDSVNDLDGRTFTYAFIGFTGGNNRPVYSTLYYVTEDGYRYQQDLRGLDPNGYALYANTFGFLDDNEPLYKTLRSDNWPVDNLPLGVSAQAAEYPIFFSDISPGGPAEPGMTLVLNALGIPLEPPSPQISNVTFDGTLGGSVTATGSGGVFSFDTTDTVSYQIVISRDGSDFDPATPDNRVLTGIAYSGAHQVTWDGLDNNNQPFPASATPYAYRASGRNGEVHFPIIDAENNGNPPSILGGGPTITRLNGIDPNDTTVFFDDRGYLTRSGELIGNLNGTLCPGPNPAAADPAVSPDGSGLINCLPAVGIRRQQQQRLQRQRRLGRCQGGKPLDLLPDPAGEFRPRDPRLPGRCGNGDQYSGYRRSGHDGAGQLLLQQQWHGHRERGQLQHEHDRRPGHCHLRQPATRRQRQLQQRQRRCDPGELSSHPGRR